MITRLEHANITVPDIDAAIAFLKCVEPGFQVLHDSGDGNDYRWAHVGTHQGYLAVETPHDPGAEPARRQHYHDYGVNHIGMVVEDAEALAIRLRAAGYVEHYKVEDHPARIRRYFTDAGGFEWEFVQYLTDDPDRRFAYG